MDICTAPRELEEDARAEGQAEGRSLMNELNRKLIQDGRIILFLRVWRRNG